MISFEKANELKSNGFVQPAVAIGQFWYTDAGVLCWVDFIDDSGYIVLKDTIGIYHRYKTVESLVFAVSEFDILRDISMWKKDWINSTQQDNKIVLHGDELADYWIRIFIKPLMVDFMGFAWARVSVSMDFCISEKSDSE